MNSLDLISRIVYILPWRVSYFVLRGVSFLYYIFCRRKFLIIANLRLAFPDLAMKKIERIAYENLFESALSFWEFLRLRYTDGESLKARVEIEEGEEIWQELKEGRRILVGVHMGSWELVNSYFALNISCAIIVRRQKNNALDKFVNLIRRRYNLKIIYEDDLKGLARIMRQNINLGLVFDHGTRKTKIYADFFSRQVPVPIGPLRLAWRFKRKIIPVVVKRKGTKHLIKLFRPVALEKKEDFSPVANYLNRCFEEFIRDNPIGFLWAYKRFKRAKDVQLVVFSDTKAGHRHQALSLAEIISQVRPAKVRLIELRLRRGQKVVLDIVNLLLRSPSNLGFWALKIILGKSFNAVFHYGDIFISCGSTTASLARLVALFMGAKTFQILRPNSARKRYDLIIIPEHDEFSQRKNVLRIKGALHFISSEKEEKAGDRLRNYLWQQKDFSLKIGIFIGAPLKKSASERSKKECEKFIQSLKAFSLSERAGLLITTSRRTPLWLEEKLKEEFSHFSHTLFLLIANEKNYDFAASGIRALSSGLIVSADSISMITEAASSRDTFVIDLFSAASQSSKHKRFLGSLLQGGYVRQISADSLPQELKVWQRKKSFLKCLENDKIVREHLKKILGK